MEIHFRFFLSRLNLIKNAVVLSFITDFTAENPPMSERYDVIDELLRFSLSKYSLCYVINIGSEMNLHFIRYLWNELYVLYPRAHTVWNENSFQILFITWWFRKKYQYFMKKGCILRKIPRKIRPGALCFTRRENAASYDVTGKEARNLCKKVLCYVWLFEKLWNSFMKGRIIW